MSGPPRKYVLDTNLFIDGWRNRQRLEELERFHRLFAPFEYLSAVVVHELCAGARTRADRRELERSVLEPFRAAGRLVTPTAEAWERAGDAIAKLARHEAGRLGTVSRAFGNDVLLAMSCRESGLTLVTRNQRDFERIAGVAPFRYVGPWPGTGS